ncbi:MAG: ZIP family metal transporter [Candidatus Portnoybacteria bacterium]|nr:ZIP family metal transporter [Candidatus Portnoybacteria bacterium]
MTQVWLYALISVFLISAISLVGVFIFSLKKAFIQKITLPLVSFAVGGLLGDAFIHLLPESFEKTNNSLKIAILIIAGVLIFFSLEKFLRWRHCHDFECKEHSHILVNMNLAGDSVHNFIDGIIIAASYIVSLPLGIATTLAVALHEIPQEIGDFGIFIHSGLSRGKALLYNFLASLACVLGAILTLLIGQHLGGFAFAILPLTAGGFLYIAGSDLIPELHRETKISTSLVQLLSIIGGVIIMALLILLD